MAGPDDFNKWTDALVTSAETDHMFFRAIGYADATNLYAIFGKPVVQLALTELLTYYAGKHLRDKHLGGFKSGDDGITIVDTETNSDMKLAEKVFGNRKDNTILGRIMNG